MPCAVLWRSIVDDAQLQALQDQLDREEQDLETEIAHQERIAYAKAIVGRKQAEARAKFPPREEDDSLAAWKQKDLGPTTYAVADLLKTGTKGTLIAGFKTGKSSMALELSRCLVDEQPFLDRFDTTLEGNLGYFNCEMTEKDWLEYANPIAIVNDTRLRVLHLNGYSLPINTDLGAEYAVDWLRRNEVGFWVLDPWSSIRGWAHVGENDNTSVGELLLQIDQIKMEAGVRELLICTHTRRPTEYSPTPTGARGASAFDDWPDARWMLTKDEQKVRYLVVEGRNVGLDQVTLGWDNGRLSITGGVRAASQRIRAMEELIEIVTAKPGRNKSQNLRELSVTGTGARQTALDDAIDQGASTSRRMASPICCIQRLLLDDYKE